MRMEPELVVARRKAFKAMKRLERRGFLALKNFMCCGSCAGAQIAHDVEAMSPRRRDRVKGAVLWTEQEEERMREYGFLLLSYGRIVLRDESGNVTDAVGMPTEEIGKAVVATFRECGCEVEWDGDPLSFIRVILTKREG